MRLTEISDVTSSMLHEINQTWCSLEKTMFYDQNSFDVLSSIKCAL